MRALPVFLLGFLVLTWTGLVWPAPESGADADSSQPDSVSMVASAPETAAVADRGILYLYGNRMEPPYVFVMERDTVWVNGVQFIPPMRREPVPKVTVTRTDTLRHELNVSVDQEVFRLLREGVAYDSVVARAAEIYAMSDLMDSMHVLEGTLELYWRGRGGLPDYARIPEEIPPPRRPHAEFLTNRARTEAASLERGSLILWKAGGFSVIPARKCLKMEDQIRQLKARGWATAEDAQEIGSGQVDLLLHPLATKGGESE